MKIYQSPSSLLVKIITIGALILMTLVTFFLFAVDKNGQVTGFVLTLLIVAPILYFYANSLDKIIVDKDTLTLKKNIGQIIIPLSAVNDVQQVVFSNLTMIWGSLGVFGFIGSTIEGSNSFVKDRKNMVQIVSNDKKFLISTDQPEELVYELKNRTKK